MTMFVFVGPTLRPEEVASAAPGAVCLPPVAQGDVYRAVRQGARAIGIIDGYFSGAPSVWHKEILWALAEGIQIFGSASMGALRGAELHTFGMRGIGRIFEAYRDGVFEDDDEVAVVHGPAETDFMVASEPMVNIRATLARAEADGVISPSTRHRLEAAGKSLFFPHRSWPAVLNLVRGEGHQNEVAAFEKWLPGNTVDQKREDALEMLAAMQDAVAADQTPSAAFRFERTHFWDDLVERVAGERAARETDVTAERILDEVRLLGPDAYRIAMKNALARLLAERESLRGGFTPPPEAKAAVISEHRRDLGLYRRSQLDAWMSENHLDQASYDRLVEHEALLRQFTEANPAILASYLLDELRMSGRFHQLFKRASDKTQVVAREPDPASLPNTVQLRFWYFEDRLGVPVPDDIHSVAATLGFENIEHFNLMLRREWMYSHATNENFVDRNKKNIGDKDLLG